MSNNRMTFRPVPTRSPSAQILLLATALSAGMAMSATAQTTAPPLSAPQTTAPSLSAPQTTAPSLSAPAAAPAPVSDVFYTGTWTSTHWRASEAMGQAVYNRSNERVGDIEELLIDGNGQIMAAVIGIGGFLGMGERKVAVSYRSFTMSRDEKGTPKLVADLNKAALDKAPEYKRAANPS